MGRAWRPILARFPIHAEEGGRSYHPTGFLAVTLEIDVQLHDNIPWFFIRRQFLAKRSRLRTKIMRIFS